MTRVRITDDGWTKTLSIQTGEPVKEWRAVLSWGLDSCYNEDLLHEIGANLFFALNKEKIAETPCPVCGTRFSVCRATGEFVPNSLLFGGFCPDCADYQVEVARRRQALRDSAWESWERREERRDFPVPLP